MTTLGLSAAGLAIAAVAFTLGYLLAGRDLYPRIAKAYEQGYDACWIEDVRKEMVR